MTIKQWTNLRSERVNLNKQIFQLVVDFTKPCSSFRFWSHDGSRYTKIMQQKYKLWLGNIIRIIKSWKISCYSKLDRNKKMKVSNNKNRSSLRNSSKILKILPSSLITRSRFYRNSDA